MVQINIRSQRYTVLDRSAREASLIFATIIRRDGGVLVFHRRRQRAVKRQDYQQEYKN